jgi:hypothetical protein
MTMNRAQLAELAPELLAQITEEAAAAERERIRSVASQFLDGHAELITQMMYDGKTTGPEAAMAVLAAERIRLAIQSAAAAQASAVPTTSAGCPAPFLH